MYSPYDHKAILVISHLKGLKATVRLTIERETAQTLLFLEVLVDRSKNFINTHVQIKPINGTIFAQTFQSSVQYQTRQGKP
jgi:hypothetical protein